MAWYGMAEPANVPASTLCLSASHNSVCVFFPTTQALSQLVCEAFLAFKSFPKATLPQPLQAACQVCMAGEQGSR